MAERSRETISVRLIEAFHQQIAQEIGAEDPTELIFPEEPPSILELAYPRKISASFDRLFENLQTRPSLEPVANREHLNLIAEEFVACRTRDGVVVYNNERQPARIKEDTRHTTPLRDIEIKTTDLEKMEQALTNLPKETPVYKMYAKAGTGSEEHWFEILFTPEGSKLAQVADIMLEASFEKPEGVETEGRFFAMPEYQDVTGEEKPMELFFIDEDDKANIFVGGTTYPGDVYKPICKAMNYWVYKHGGAEMHAGATVLSYKDPFSGERKKKVQIISGLSLHGKTTLATADLMKELTFQLAQKLGVSVEELELEYELLHDDYVFLKINNYGQIEIGVYAPNGIFPAMKGENPQGLIAKNPRTILFNTVIDPDGRPNFEKAFPFVTRNREVKPTNNLRAAAPIEALGMKAAENGLVLDPTDISIITLTRDPYAPSVTKWETADDFIKYWAGLVVAPTDATVERAEGLYFNYMCTDFDVAGRGSFMARLKKLWQRIEERQAEKERKTSIAGYTVNTGAPEKPESVAAVQAILLDLMDHWNFHPELGINFAGQIPGFGYTPYIPWDLLEGIVELWEERKKERKIFFQQKRVNLEKANLIKGKALI